MTQSTDPPESPETERRYLAEAVRMAVKSAIIGQLPFGALVVRDGEVIGNAINTALAGNDPTAHAEVQAVRNACRILGVLHLTGATVVSSCEPCAVCHAVAVSAGIVRIVYAAPKELVPDLGYPAPPDNGPLMTRMQDALRALAPEQLVYVPTDGADEPFARYLAVVADGR